MFGWKRWQVSNTRHHARLKTLELSSWQAQQRSTNVFLSSLLSSLRFILHIFFFITLGNLHLYTVFLKEICGICISYAQNSIQFTLSNTCRHENSVNTFFRHMKWKVGCFYCCLPVCLSAAELKVTQEHWNENGHHLVYLLWGMSKWNLNSNQLCKLKQYSSDLYISE